MKSGDYSEALPIWDTVLAQVPEYGDGYLQRLICRNNSQAAASPAEFFELLTLTIQDADASIALDPTANGDNFYYRSTAYQQLGREQIYRVDQDLYLEAALENLRVANAIGPRTDYSLRMESFVYYALGRCDEGLARARELIAQSDMTQVPVFAGLHSALASGYLCDGDLSRALKEIDTTLDVEYSAGRMFTRAVILYNLGRFEDALAQLDEVYQLEPFGNGYRRYLEALIRLEMGDRAAAMTALEAGAGNTWNRYGLYAYVQGKDALALGDRAKGIELIALAQATMLRDYGPLLKRIEAELLRLGVTPAAPTPSCSLTTTPIPSLTPTITPGAFQPTASVLEPLILVDADKGTGPHVFRPGDYPVFLFQLRLPIQGEVFRITAHLLPVGAPAGSPPELQFMFRLPDGGWALTHNSIGWGETDITDAARFLGERGDITVGVRSFGDRDIFIQNLAFTIEARLPSGETTSYGWITP